MIRTGWFRVGVGAGQVDEAVALEALEPLDDVGAAGDEVVEVRGDLRRQRPDHRSCSSLNHKCVFYYSMGHNNFCIATTQNTRC